MKQNAVQDIEHAISELSPDELDELYIWIDHHQQQQIDTKLQAHLGAGGFDAAIHEALDDERHGRTKCL